MLLDQKSALQPATEALKCLSLCGELIFLKGFFFFNGGHKGGKVSKSFLSACEALI